MNISELKDFPNINKFLASLGNFRDFKKSRKELVTHLDNTSTMLGRGTCRSVWDFSDSKVLKIPNANDGSYNDGHIHTCSSNLLEYLMYNRLKKKFPLAPCSMVFYKAVPLILMDKVEVVGEVCDDPEWIDENPDSPLCELHDGYQIGLTKKGKMVCYDYGYEGGIFEEYVPPTKYDLSDKELTELTAFPQIIELKEINDKLKEKLIKVLEKGK
jgi:hypothetical protein